MGASDRRRAEILEAFRRCVATDGLERSSMRRVAAEAGVTQPLLMHHFGSRAGLVEALVDHVVSLYVEDMERSLAGVRHERGADELLRFLFGGPFAEISERDRALFSELQASAVRDEVALDTLRETYRRFQNALKDHLAKAYPSAKPDACRRAAYGLMCLVESEDLFRGMNLPGRRVRDGLELGRGLVAGLDGETL